MEFRNSGYNIDTYVPDSVRLRSEQYCDSSVVGLRLFKELFYITDLPEVGEDMTLRFIVDTIRSCEQWYTLPPKIRSSQENSNTNIKYLLETHYGQYVYEKRKQRIFRGARMTVNKQEDDKSITTDESPFEIDIEDDTSIF